MQEAKNLYALVHNRHLIYIEDNMKRAHFMATHDVDLPIVYEVLVPECETDDEQVQFIVNFLVKLDKIDKGEE